MIAIAEILLPTNTPSVILYQLDFVIAKRKSGVAHVGVELGLSAFVFSYFTQIISRTSLNRPDWPSLVRLTVSRETAHFQDGEISLPRLKVFMTAVFVCRTATYHPANNDPGKNGNRADVPDPYARLRDVGTYSSGMCK